jgi:lipopolysaccharide transport system ATP-binding protein
MGRPVIEASRLSKSYVICHQACGDGVRPVTERAVRSPLSWLRSMRRGHGAANEEFWALRDVSFDVNQGEVVGIIGRNGAGKSTLLKLLSRITDPTSGRFRLRGRVASLLEVGTGFHPELTGRENVFLNGAILGMSREEIKRKFDEIVAFAEIEKFLDTPVKRYSTGMHLRLAFAVAAHLEPEILIVDEVLAVGDAEFRKKCLNKMENVASAQGRTVLFVSHQMAAVQHLCTRCMLLNMGRLVQSGRTDDVIKTYLSNAGMLTTASKLSARRDHQGQGDVTIEAIDLLDTRGCNVQEVASGMDLVIRGRFRVHNGATLRNCSVRLDVANEANRFFTIGTDLVNKAALELSGTGCIDFIVPDWPLSGGRYHISCVVTAEGATQDRLENATTFTVVDGDYYGTGKLYHEGWQGITVLVKHSWRLNQISPEATRDELVRRALAPGEGIRTVSSQWTSLSGDFVQT